MKSSLYIKLNFPKSIYPLILLLLLELFLTYNVKGQDIKPLLPSRNIGQIVDFDINSSKNRMLTVSADHTVKLWDIINKIVIKDIRNCKEEGISKFINDDNQFIVLNEESQVDIYDSKSGKKINTLESSQFSYICLNTCRYDRIRLSKDRKFLIGIVVNNNHVEYWELKSNKLLASTVQLKDETEKVYLDGYISFDNQWVYLFMQNGICKWDIKNKKQYCEGGFYYKQGEDVCLSNDNKWLVNLNHIEDNYFSVFNSSNLNLIEEPNLSAQPKYAQIDESSKYLYILTDKSSVYRYDLNKISSPPKLIYTKSNNSIYFYKVILLNQDQSLLLISQNGGITRIDNIDGKVKSFNLEINLEIANCHYLKSTNDILLLTTKGDFFIIPVKEIGSSEENKKSVELATEKNIKNNDKILNIEDAYFAKGSNSVFIAISGNNRYVYVWNLLDNEMRRRWTLSEQLRVRLSDNGNVVVLFSNDRIICLDVNNGDTLLNKSGLNNVSDVQIDSMGKKLAILQTLEFPNSSFTYLVDLTLKNKVFTRLNSRAAEGEHHFIEFNSSGSLLLYRNTNGAIAVFDLLQNRDTLKVSNCNLAHFCNKENSIFCLVDGRVKKINIWSGHTIDSREMSKSTQFTLTNQDILITHGTIDQPEYEMRNFQFNRNFEYEVQNNLVKRIDYNCMDTLFIQPFSDSTYIIENTKGEYKNTRPIVRDFIQNNEYVSSRYGDENLNMPYKIQEALACGFNDPKVEIYRKATMERQYRLGRDTINLFSKIKRSKPVCEIINNKELGVRGNQSDWITVNILAKDTCPLTTLNIWVNEVPIFGQKGINIEPNVRVKDSTKRTRIFSLDTIIRFQLSEGKNVIESSVLNKFSMESVRIPYGIINTITPQKHKLFFIGVGIEKFKDSTQNLMYAADDIREITNVLKRKLGSMVVIDTLLNENVTKEKIIGLKEKLRNTDIDDQVVIYYSGHGLLDSLRNYFLSTYNVNFKNPNERGLPYYELENLLDGIPSRKRAIFIDACYSGNFYIPELNTINNLKAKEPLKKGQDFDNALESVTKYMGELFIDIGTNTGTYIHSAVSGSLEAKEDFTLLHGVYSYAFIHAIDSKNTISIEELQNIIKNQVSYLTNNTQIPSVRKKFYFNKWELFDLNNK